MSLLTDNIAPQLNAMPIMSSSEGEGNRSRDIEFIASMLECMALWLKGKPEAENESQTLSGISTVGGSDPMAQWIAGIGNAQV